MEGDQLTSAWRKATYSGTNGGGCVEAATTPRRVLVRDTTNRAAGSIDVAPEAWRAFIDGLK